MNSINRFIVIQKLNFQLALHEIKAGHKKTHWMWYIFPQIKGLGSSLMNEKYSIQSLNEAKEYINNPYLRQNLINITQVLLTYKDKNIEDIMEYPDNLKLCSCMTLFEFVAPEIQEFSKVLEIFYSGVRDEQTIKIIKEEN